MAANMANQMQTELDSKLQSGDFDCARCLLQNYLESEKVLDPRSDRFWAPIADNISAVIQNKSGVESTIPFWEGLLEFFINKIEPVWGHAHKGHIYFRLGFATARRNLDEAFSNFKLAYADDLTLENAKGGTQEQIELRCQNYSAYVALAILERIKDSDLVAPTDKQHFLDQLLGPSFDAAIAGVAVRPDLVLGAFASIVPPQASPICQKYYEELNKASSFPLPFAVVSLTGTVLESVLLGILKDSKGMNQLPGKNRSILKEELWLLLQEAINSSVFPSPSIQAAFQLVQIFRNRLHPGNELRQKYKLTPRVSLTVKLFLELGLLEWQKTHERNDE